MNYNIHPIFVHFPIALLFIYSLLIIIPVAKALPRFAWRDIRLVVLAIGLLGAWASLSTGESAEHATQASHKLVNTHAAFASTSTWIYVALLIIELLPWADALLAERVEWIKYRNFVRLLMKWFYQNWLISLLAVVGLFAITITGVLGGSIVYGTTADPLAPIVLKMLGLN